MIDHLAQYAVGLVLDTLKECAQSITQLKNFGNQPFPEGAFRRMIERGQAHAPENCKLKPEEIDMMIELGHLCHKLGNHPDIIDYHNRAEKMAADLNLQRCNFMSAPASQQSPEASE